MSKHNNKSIIDHLLLDKKAQPFIKALAKYNLLSILGSTYTKRMPDKTTKQMPYTVFVPKKLKLPKSPEEAIQLLKCHVFKNKYDEESIEKMCEKYGNNEITLSSLGGLRLMVSCSSKQKVLTVGNTDVSLKKEVDCSNGIFFFIDGALPVELEVLKKESKEPKPAILDLLYAKKAYQPFVMACAKYGIASMLCCKYFDKRNNRRNDYTVFVPPKLKIPKDVEKATHYLRSHFGKRNFNIESIAKYCKKQQEQGIVELTLGTMTDVTFQIDCGSYVLKDGKNKFVLSEKNMEKGHNGNIYYLSKELHIPERILE